MHAELEGSAPFVPCSARPPAARGLAWLLATLHLGGGGAPRKKPCLAAAALKKGLVLGLPFGGGCLLGLDVVFPCLATWQSQACKVGIDARGTPFGVASATNATESLGGLGLLGLFRWLPHGRCRSWPLHALGLLRLLGLLLGLVLLALELGEGLLFELLQSFLLLQCFKPYTQNM